MQQNRHDNNKTHGYGNGQALGIVTDVGAFLPLVAQEIRKLH
ncbi:MAG TPA: hypothetical protein VGA92_00675 [Candidatus Nitrosotenuis sp.]